jgi:thioesterase domain-containing protein
METELQKIVPYKTLGLNLVELIDEEVSMSIDLPPNINDKGTMFAGSIYSALVLSGWTLARHLFHKTGGEFDVVIKESTNSFIKPVRSSAIAKAYKAAELSEAKNGNKSLSIEVVFIDSDEEICAKLNATYIGIHK